MQENADVHAVSIKDSLGLGFYETHPKKVWFKKYCMSKGRGGGLDAEDRCCAASRGEGSADTKVTGARLLPCTLVPSDTLLLRVHVQAETCP